MPVMSALERWQAVSLLDDDMMEFDGTNERCPRCGEHPDFCQWWDYEETYRPSECANHEPVPVTDSEEAS